MRKGIQTALILCLILAVIGAGLVIAGVALGGELNFRLDWKNRTISAGGGDLIKGELTPEAFTELEIDVSTADVNVERGTLWAISYALSDEPEITQDGSLLRLAVQERSTIGFVGITFDETNDPFVTVTVPEGAALERITLHTATGDVLLSDIAARSLSAESNTGDIRLHAVSADTLSAKTNTGEILASELTVSGEAEAKTNTGDVELSLTGRTSDYAMELKTDTGDVEVNGIEHGSAYATGSGIPLRAKSNTGDVEVRFG